MKLYTILFLMLFLGYPYPALSGQVSSAEHDAILNAIKKVEHKIHGDHKQITNFKTNLATLKNLLNEKKVTGNHVTFKDKKATLAKTKRVLDDFDVLKDKNEPCHRNGCDDLGDHLKKLAYAIRRDSTPEEKAAAKAKAGADAKPKAETDVKSKGKTDADAKAKADADAKAKADVDAKTKVDAEAKAKADADAKEKAAASVTTPTVSVTVTQTTNPPSTTVNHGNAGDNHIGKKGNNQETKNNKTGKTKKDVPPPPPAEDRQDPKKVKNLQTLLTDPNSKNDVGVENAIETYIIHGDSSAQQRIFEKFQKNDTTKHFFISENHPPVGGNGTGNSWLALFGMCLLGMCIGAGSLFAFFKRKKQLTPDQIKDAINEHFKNTSLNNDLKQNIILNQLDNLDITNKEDKRFYENLCEKAIGQLDENAKQAFLLKQIQVETTPDNKHLPIAQSIVNQLDRDAKRTLGIGTGGSYNPPSTPADKANQINLWLKDSNVKNHKNLSGVFAAPVAPEGAYFLGEVLTAAGPRKTEEDELGEDIAGMMMKGDYAIFWIMDGSSNYSKIKNDQNQEIYSSRVLAMTLAEQVQILMRQKSNLIGSQVNHYLKEAIRNTMSELNKRINQPEIKSLLQKIAKNGNNITVATTATLGFLHKNGELSVCKIGDDKIAAGGEMINSKYGALMICDVQSELDVLKVDMAQLKEDWFEEYHIHHVQTVIASSDGINDTIYKWIQNNKQVSPDQIKRFKEHKNQTFDDKSLCIIQIINNK